MTTPTPDNDREQQDAERRKAVALFRYGVIADLIHTEPGQRGLYSKPTCFARRRNSTPTTASRWSSTM
jgi:hypothetical protein